jgi:beta-1,4-N-acetylglucosaminyltransferase
MTMHDQNCDVLLVASNGGHLLQLTTLVADWPTHTRHWVTFDKSDARSLLVGEEVTWAYHPTNRSVWNLVRNGVLALRLLRRLRPRVIVTTGAGVAVPFCYLGRVFGARIIYIESFSRIHEPSLTAKLVHPAVHSFYVQWPQLERRFRKAEYHGAVF